MQKAIIPISLLLLFITSGCKTWSAFKSDSAEMLEKTKDQTKEVIEGTQRASGKAVNKMQDAFGDD